MFGFDYISRAITLIYNHQQNVSGCTFLYTACSLLVQLENCLREPGYVFAWLSLVRVVLVCAFMFWPGWGDSFDGIC
jgi:hypothetical protein